MHLMHSPAELARMSPFAQLAHKNLPQPARHPPAICQNWRSMLSTSVSKKSSDKPRAGKAAKSETTVEDMAGRIATAIYEHRLMPGTKLGEDRLAGIFGTSRAKVREVLARLAHDQMVDLFPQRGAYVAKPSIEQAQDVFEARRLIEPGVLRRLIATLDEAKTQRLRDHLKQEQAARAREDKPATVRLSGEFHVLLAELAGNSALLRSVRELSTLTCLIISLYDAPTSSACRVDEHAALVDAITCGDVAAAEQCMLHHLNHIHDNLQLDSESGEADLEQILGL